MEDGTWREQRMIEATFLTCAVRALMASHPRPADLREAWDQEMAALWANHSKAMAGAENPLQDRMRRLQAAHESCIPRS